VRPTPGNVFVVVDIKSEEPRLGAYLSQDPKLLQATKGDVYSAVHNAIYGTSGTLDKKDAVQRAARDRVKPVMLSFLYMGTWHTFKDKIGCTEIEAKTIERNLNYEFKIYKEWARDVIAAAKYAGIIRTPLHHYPLLVDEQCNERQVVNHLIQGCGADLMRELVDSCIKAGYVPNTTLFDGLYFETTKEGVEGFSKELITLCNRTLNRVFPVHTPWEMEITPCLWADKPYHEFGTFEKPEQVDLLRRLHWGDVI
jgi:DNA polymerase I-like protein with 3'-5' exonuclease and polymerase domains